MILQHNLDQILFWKFLVETEAYLKAWLETFNVNRKGLNSFFWFGNIVEVVASIHVMGSQTQSQG